MPTEHDLMPSPTEPAVYTTPNGVTFHAQKAYRPVYRRSMRAATGRTGATTTIFDFVDVPLSHPFTKGSTVTIGSGRTHWQVVESYPSGVVLQSPTGRHREFAYGRLAHLHLL